MKTAELRKKLRDLGAKFKQGSKHTKVYMNGEQSTIPRHTEIPDLLAKKILKQLKVK